VMFYVLGRSLGASNPVLKVKVMANSAKLAATKATTNGKS
jgi:hypothetical protein